MENLKTQKCKEAITSVIGNLQQHSALYKKYLDVLTQEQKLLVKKDMQQFENVLALKEKLSDDLVTKDEERIEILDKVAFIFGLAEGRDVKIKHLVQIAEKRESDILIETKSELDQILTEVKVVNKINEELLQNSMKFVKTVFETVAGKQEKRNTYGNSGAINKYVDTKRNLINTRG